jgi:hypothetical protein
VFITFDLPQTNITCDKFGNDVIFKVTQAVMFGTKTPATNIFPPLNGIPSKCAVVAIMIVSI